MKDVAPAKIVYSRGRACLKDADLIGDAPALNNSCVCHWKNCCWGILRSTNAARWCGY